jgi:hypothetical protein
MKAYSVVLLALVGFLGYLLNNRGELEAKYKTSWQYFLY